MKDKKMEERFKDFAARFVYAYWEVVKSGTFAMPPNEPVEESLEELLGRVSHSTEIQNSTNRSAPIYNVRMEDTLGDWWLFSFRDVSGTWELTGASAKSDDKKNPHDLLGAVYAGWFRPFLTHVTELATKRVGIEPGGGTLRR